MEQPLGDLPLEERKPIRWWPQLAAVLLILVELGWVVPWRQAVSGMGMQQPSWKVWLAMGVVITAAYLAAFTIEELRLIRSARAAALGGLLVLSIIFTSMMLYPASPVKAADGDTMLLDAGFLVTLGFTVLLWQRGIGLGIETVRPIHAWRHFRLGLVALMLHTFAATVWGLPVVGLFGLTGYVFIGLLAVMLSRISYVSLTRSAKKSPFDRRWMVTTIGVLTGVTLFAEVMGALLTGQFRIFLEGVRALLSFLAIGFLFLASLPALLLTYLFMPLAPYLQGLRVELPPPPEEGPIGAYPALAYQPQPGPLPLILQIICFWTVVVLLILLIFWRVRQRIQNRRLAIPEGPESMLDEGDASRLARKALQEIWDGLARRVRPQGRAAAAQRVRQIYGELLDLCDAIGQGKPDSDTPFEFEPSLKGTFPAYAPDLDALTHAYVRVRYGEYPENVAELQPIEAAWARLKVEGEQMKKQAAALKKIQSELPH